MKPIYIFDTDMGNDVDDLMAQILLIRGLTEVEKQWGAAVVNKGNRLAPAFVDLLNRFYDCPNVPIGWCAHGPTPAESAAGEKPFLRPVLEQVGPSLLDYDPDCKNWPDAVTVLRKTLAGAIDQSVIYISIGFTTILKELLLSPADEYSPLTGRELIESKIKFVSMMGGGFEHLVKDVAPHVEHNIAGDIESAQVVTAELPCPIFFSGFELGERFEFPGHQIDEALSDNLNHPFHLSYKLYQGFNHNRPLWDLTSVLFALAPEAGHFDISELGSVSIAADGVSSFSEHHDGKHRYLKFRKDTMSEVMQIFIENCLYSSSSSVLSKPLTSYV